MNSKKGFSLIELMVALAIFAVLVTISYPSYLESVRNARRAEAQATLQGLSQAMERFYTNNGTYAAAAASAADTGAPAIFSTKSPIDGSDAFYNLKIVAANGSAYVIAAEPINTQAGNGLLILKSTGVRGWDVDNDANGLVSGLGPVPDEVEASEWTW